MRQHQTTIPCSHDRDSPLRHVLRDYKTQSLPMRWFSTLSQAHVACFAFNPYRERTAAPTHQAFAGRDTRTKTQTMKETPRHMPTEHNFGQMTHMENCYHPGIHQSVAEYPLARG